MVCFVIDSNYHYRESTTGCLRNFRNMLARARA
jgi:hypothetical protein